MALTLSFDLSDPLIREMVARNHVPGEKWLIYAGEPNELAFIRCETCRYPWPCPTRQAYEEWSN